MTQQTNALLNLNHEEVENKTSNLNLVSVQKEKRVRLFRMNGVNRGLILHDYRYALTRMKDPCIFFNRREKVVYIDDGSEIEGVRQATRPFRSESKIVSFQLAPVVGEEDLFAVRVSCIKSVFSDYLQLRIVFEDKKLEDGRNVMRMLVHSLYNL